MWKLITFHAPAHNFYLDQARSRSIVHRDTSNFANCKLFSEFGMHIFYRLQAVFPTSFQSTELHLAYCGGGYKSAGSVSNNCVSARRSKMHKESINWCHLHFQKLCRFLLGCKTFTFFHQIWISSGREHHEYSLVACDAVWFGLLSVYGFYLL